MRNDIKRRIEKAERCAARSQRFGNNGSHSKRRDNHWFHQWQKWMRCVVCGECGHDFVYPHGELLILCPDHSASHGFCYVCGGFAAAEGDSLDLDGLCRDCSGEFENMEGILHE